MEKSVKCVDSCSQSVASQIFQVASDLERQRKILNIVKLSALPDRGAKLQKNVAQLENLLEKLTLESNSANEVMVKEKPANETVTDKENISDCYESKNNRGHENVVSENAKTKLSSTAIASSKDNKNKCVTQVFAKDYDTDLSSFDKLSVGAPTPDNSLGDLVQSPSFKTWRQTENLPGVKLTEAKPLFETFVKGKYQNAVFSSNHIGSLMNEETVQKLHHSLRAYPENAPQESEPESLRTPLMKHQLKGLSWMVWREEQVPSGGILADDMGFGKTLTVISLIQKQKENENYLSDKSDNTSQGTLIVCVASVLHQWHEEIQKHCKKDSLSVLLYHGPKRERDINKIKTFDIVLTTYNILMSERKSLLKNAKRSVVFLSKWERVVLDEAHTIKNYNSQTAQAVFEINCFRRWCVTGTPIHNEIKDMYALVKFLKFAPFDDYKKWKMLTNDQTTASIERLNLLVKCIVLRRTKGEVDKFGKPFVEMVKKSVTICYLELSSEEQQMYDKLDARVKETLDKYLASLKRTPTSSNLLVLLLRLQQCCNHPSLLGEEVEDVADDSLSDISKCLSALNIESCSSTNTSLNSSLDISFTSFQNPSLSDPLVKSTKLKKLFQKLDQIAEESNYMAKSVIVSQWVSMLQIIAKLLEKENVPYHMIVGSTSVEDRQSASNDLNTNPNGCKILLLSLKAGGVGLNLVGANHLFLMDLHWNPALENQACDRIHRVDQTKEVFIYKFVCRSTIEEQILKLQMRKSTDASNALHGGSKVTKGISMEDFKMLFNIKL